MKIIIMIIYQELTIYLTHKYSFEVKNLLKIKISSAQTNPRIVQKKALMLLLATPKSLSPLSVSGKAKNTAKYKNGIINKAEMIY